MTSSTARRGRVRRTRFATRTSKRSARGVGRPWRVSASLERMRRMRAEDERGLEEELVDVPRARLVRGEAVVLRSIRQLVAETKAQELGGIEADVRLDGPLPAADQLLHVV